MYMQINKEKGYFTLIHFYSEHKYNWKAKKAETNLTRIEDDPSAAIPLVPPMLIARAPSESNVEDEDEMTFTGAWFVLYYELDW
jgi:hypothetical protein